jgi:hypothetical protein
VVHPDVRDNFTPYELIDSFDIHLQLWCQLLGSQEFFVEF